MVCRVSSDKPVFGRDADQWNDGFVDWAPVMDAQRQVAKLVDRLAALRARPVAPGEETALVRKRAKP